MLNTICFIVGLIGAALLSYGAWLLLPSIGFITAGLLCLLWSFLVTRSIAFANAAPTPKGD